MLLVCLFFGRFGLKAVAGGEREACGSAEQVAFLRRELALVGFGVDELIALLRRQRGLAEETVVLAGGQATPGQEIGIFGANPKPDALFHGASGLWIARFWEVDVLLRVQGTVINGTPRIPGALRPVQERTR